MGAKDKLNSANVVGAFVVAGLIGGVTDSTAVLRHCTGRAGGRGVERG